MTTKTIGYSYPTVNLAVNKSRIKMYNKASDMPTFYLKKGDEFQIELFNPTTDTVKAVIKLNGKQISNGGLVLRPGERVFLDRFLDINKKFLFDTYEVSNSEEVRKAIEDNGDLEVEFYREYVQPTLPRTPLYWNNDNGWNSLHNNTFYGNVTSAGGYVNNTTTGEVRLDGLTTTSLNYNDTTLSVGSTYDANPIAGSLRSAKPKRGSFGKLKKSKSVETGRVEQGSTSNQEFKTVNKTFESNVLKTYAFKILPISQKTVTTNDLRHAYCTNCGLKNSTKNNFCPKCGTKV